MDIRIYRKRGGRSYNYTGTIPAGWVARDADGKEYATAEEADKAINDSIEDVKKKVATKKKAVTKKED